MSKLLFSLRGVPEDEAFEIRELLEANNIDYYETSAGNWGISLPALWLHNNGDLDCAQKLLSEFHIQRAKNQREKYKQLKQEGKSEQWLGAFREKPFRFIIYIGAVVFILYLYVRMLNEFGL